VAGVGAQTLDDALAQPRATVPAASRIELLTTADLTPRARSELAQRGVDVVEMAALVEGPAAKPSGGS
jgi:hypothetical protein